MNACLLPPETGLGAAELLAHKTQPVPELTVPVRP